ncbi:hypothetical protein JDN40_17345 [Rhodomicrobium vannielii ATCC 17100]|uniref:hypothetical protein n=1 Tax=Rhodomicrobium vannielii TaxID=1069 RepID=UPI00191AB433|nr:hypothetical protein [Rhodomicrobium vannielii]MBJ7535876.1 hypothetical protein [Rhodomicrobium vannielii ATCC 17100]
MLRRVPMALPTLLVALLCGVTQTEASKLFTDEAEFLIAPVPSAEWSVQETETRPKFAEVDYLPNGQTSDDWNRLVTVQTWRDPGFRYDALATAMKEHVEATQPCKSTAMQKLADRKVSGYDAALYALSCPENKTTGKGEYTLILQIQGRDAVYGVQRSWRGAAFEPGAIPVPHNEGEEWLAWFDRIQLCDNRLAGKSCGDALGKATATARKR